MNTKEERTAGPSGDKSSAAKANEKPNEKVAEKPNEKPHDMSHGGNGHVGNGKAAAARTPDRSPNDKAKTPPSGVPAISASKPDPKPEARPDPRPDPKPDPKVEAKPPTPAPAPAPAPRAAVAAATDAVDVTVLPPPDELPDGDPDAPAPPPGVAPDGDARSLRRIRPGSPALFALVYRAGDALVINRGEVGRRGTWRAVSYPSPAAASNAYAQTCSELTSEGFTDFHR